MRSLAQVENHEYPRFRDELLTVATSDAEVAQLLGVNRLTARAWRLGLVTPNLARVSAIPDAGTRDRLLRALALSILDSVGDGA